MSILSSGRALIDANPVLRQAGLTTNMHYADFGCGPLGHFVFPASEIVSPEGKVYAVDILKSSLSSLEGRVQIEAKNNISLVWGDFERVGGVKIPPGTLHLISIVNIVPVLLRSPNAISEIKRLLRPDGKLLLIDWVKEKTAIGPPPEHRVSSQEAEYILTKAGFFLKHLFNAGPFHWAQVFNTLG
jgi:ubiquinone/menaquinone biosynthesis C-methylase UbiE